MKLAVKFHIKIFPCYINNYSGKNNPNNRYVTKPNTKCTKYIKRITREEDK